MDATVLNESCGMGLYANPLLAKDLRQSVISHSPASEATGVASPQSRLWQ